MDGSATIRASRSLLSPKLGVLLHLRRAAAFYANASRGFRQTDGVIDDPSLPLITAWAYESGVKFDLRRANIDIALFRMDVSDEQTFDPISLTSTSGGHSRRQGVEIDVRANLGDALALDGDWTFTDAKYGNLVTEDGDTLSGARVFNTARYSGSASLQLAPPSSSWSAHVGTNVVGPYTPFAEPGVEVRAFALLHAGVGKRVGRALLDLGIRNLLDRTYAELRAGGFVAPGQPRSLFVTVRYDF
jgi:iron complex outermembrane receptor protein